MSITISRSRLVALVSLLAAGTAPALARAQQMATVDTAFYGGLTYRNVGPVRGGRSIAAAGSTSRPERVLLRRHRRRRLEDDGRRHDLARRVRPFLQAAHQWVPWPCAKPIPMSCTRAWARSLSAATSCRATASTRRRNGGTSWTHVGLPESQAIARIRVHPRNCDIAYAAVLGHSYGPNPERGVYKTRMAARTWTRVLFKSEHAGAVDLVMDPGNPEVLYAAIWQVYRTPWSMESGGPEGGLYKSTDGGATWTRADAQSGTAATDCGARSA